MLPQQPMGRVPGQMGMQQLQAQALRQPQPMGGNILPNPGQRPQPFPRNTFNVTPGAAPRPPMQPGQPPQGGNFSFGQHPQMRPEQPPLQSGGGLNGGGVSMPLPQNPTAPMQYRG